MTRKVKVMYVSWITVHREILKLAASISRSYKPDTIIAIAKGGLIPARILADLLDVREIGFIEVKFYKRVGEAREKPYITFTAFPPLDGKRILVVDDIVDSGRTLQVVADLLSRFKYADLKFASLYAKPWSTLLPDYYGRIVEEWIVFPWEICETVKEGLSLEGVDVVEVLEYCESMK
ncbi:MAG: phosphoribosyltransferase [Desulfurococcus sp.]|nr:phosphoribosyltransferase [Desulfurococcus sp.]